MSVNRNPIFAAVKKLRDNKDWTQPDVDLLDRAIDMATGEHTARLYPEPVTSVPQPVAAFKLSEHSINELAGVHPQLKRCVELAIGYTLVDFRVQQGLRTVAEQRAAVAAGNSRTMKSKHLPQADGKAWAVDLVAIVGGKVSWEFNVYGAIAAAMDRAATELAIAGHVRWGCAWDRVLSDFGGSSAAYLAEAKAYAARHPGSDLLDAPHFEWVS